MKLFPRLFFSLFFLVVLLPFKVYSCTNIIVTKGASADGSTLLVYSNDGQWLYHLKKSPAADHPAGDSVVYRNWDGHITGKIAQVAHTYGVLGFQMNEHQVAIGETTFTGREELWNKKNFLKYWHLMSLALERSKTAREAVEVITSLVATYGYGSEGESISITDPNEAWLLEIIGKGPDEKGAVWVARRIPDGMVCAHANMARIGSFPMDDPENCLFAPDVISFAIRKGFYRAHSGLPFRFNEVYNPPTADRLKYCETRVWSVFRRCAPSLKLSADYHRAVVGASRYPLWIAPDKKLGLKDVMSLVRDHYEGTAYDMTQGLVAGPFGSPNRCSPLSWESDTAQFSWERPISTPNTCFSVVAQSRAYLPDYLGGILWFGEDDTYTTCYVPVFASVEAVASPFNTGDINHYNRKSAWWAFNFVSNYANLKYAYMIKDIQKLQSELESRFIQQLDSVTHQAAGLNRKEGIDLLTRFSDACAHTTLERWLELGDFLIVRYNDGYVKNEKQQIESKGYPPQWRKQIIQNAPDRYRLPQIEKVLKEEEMPF